jgi:hypothetical protein
MDLISTQIKTTGFIYLGEQDKYSGYHQPATFVNTYMQYPISLNNNSQMLGYNPLLPVPIPLIIGYNPLTIYEEPSEEIFVGIYVCFDAYYYGNSFIPFDKYSGGIQFVKQAYGGGNPFLASKPVIRVDRANGNYALYRFELAARYVSRNKYYRYVENTASAPVAEKPNYLCFANGYYLDNRTFPSNLKIIPTISGIETIGYYQKNHLEAIADLTTIEWREYQIECKKDEPIYLPIYNLVLGTLYCSSELKSLISSTATTGAEYSWDNCFADAIADIFAHWMSLYAPLAAAQNNITPNTIGFSSTVSTKTVQVFELERVVRRISANNNCWQTTPIAELNNDLNPLPTHPMFLVNTARTYDYHFSPQIQGIGSLNMDSPRLIELHQLFNCGLYAPDPKTGDPRLVNLGWLIRRIAGVLGIRPKPDGLIDQIEDKKLVPEVVDRTKKLNPDKVGVMSFGDGGIVLKRITNRFKKKEIVSDECVVIPDLLSLINERFHQLNIALGIQASSAIEIKDDNGTARYNNQLELMLEMVNLLTSQHKMIESSLVSGLVTQSQSNEIIAGLGLPSVTKTIPIEIDKKVQHIPYKGIAAHRSISQEVATCAYNIGIVTGQLI